MNGTEMYTIFDLPIAVTNKISADVTRPPCDVVNNPIIDQETLNTSANTFTRIAGTTIETSGKGSGLGGSKPGASAQDGLGAASATDWYTGLHTLWIGISGVFLLW
jgi:hypothetical protein